MNIFSKLLPLWGLIASLLIGSVAYAGGPLNVADDASGKAYLWKDNRLVYKYDDGPLSGIVPNIGNACDQDKGKDPCKYLEDCGIVSCVSALFQKWQDAALMLPGEGWIKTTSLEVVNRGSLGVDVTTDNIGDTYQKAKDEKYAIVIFDSDGSIIDKEMGKGQSKFVIGVGGILPPSEDYEVTTGRILLNGFYRDGDENNKEATNIGFSSTVLHELGHLIGLDHTQINLSSSKKAADGDLSEAQGIATMYPLLVTESQFSLHQDDKIAVSSLYPTEEFKTKFCEATGTVLDQNGEGYQGVNVFAEADDPQGALTDVRSFVSGAFYPAGTRNGDYVLAGLLPGRKYKVYYEELEPDFQKAMATSIGPFFGESGFPSGFGTGQMAEAECNPAVENFAVEKDISLGNTTIGGSAKDVVQSEAKEEEEGKRKGWCMSLGGTEGGWTWIAMFLTIAVLAFKKKQRSNNPPFSKGGMGELNS